MDKATGRRLRTVPSLRKRRAAELLVSGEAKTRAEAMRMAGYSPLTAYAPTQNGFTVEEAIRLAHREEDGSLRSLGKLSMGVLKGMLEDPSAPDAVKATVAVHLVKMAREQGEHGDGDLTLIDRLRADYTRVRAMALHLRLALDHPAQAARLHGQLLERLEQLPSPSSLKDQAKPQRPRGRPRLPVHGSGEPEVLEGEPEPVEPRAADAAEAQTQVLDVEVIDE